MQYKPVCDLQTLELLMCNCKKAHTWLVAALLLKAILKGEKIRTAFEYNSIRTIRK